MDIKHSDQFERGNALFFILIAVVLLGLLTMILSRGGSSTDQTGDFEQNRVIAAQVLRYSKSVEAAIQQMQFRGVSENAISFENGDTTTDYTNSRCDDVSDRSFPSCQIFDVEGGGLTYRDFPSANDGSDWIFSGANNVGTAAGPIGSTADGGGNDIIMLLPNVDDGVCIQINRDLGVGVSGTLPIDTNGISTAAFTGAFASGSISILDGDPTPFELDSEAAGCFIDAAPDPDVTYFYQVVLAR